MFVQEMRLENSQNNEYSGVVYQPNWFQIENAIRNMKIHSITGIYLAVEEGELPYLMIGGGQSGKYIIEYQSEEGEIYNLFDRRQSNEKIALVAGNQLSYYSAKILVDLNIALKAAKILAASGQLESSLNWEKWKNIKGELSSN